MTDSDRVTVREALEPFAKIADNEKLQSMFADGHMSMSVALMNGNVTQSVIHYCLKVDDFRNARAALAALASEPGVSEKSAGDLSAQLIAAANRPGVDIYTKTMLWQATTMIDALSRQQPAGEAGWQSADTAPRDGTPFIGRGGVYHNMPFAVAYRPSEFKPGEPWLNLINGHRLPEHCLSLWLPMRDERSGTSEADIAAAIRAHFLEKGNYAVLSSDGVERVYYNGFSLTSLARSIFEYLNPAPTPVAHVDETRAGKEQKPSHSPHMEGRQ